MHPTPESLRDFLDGRLSEEEKTAVENHLREHCEACELVLESLSNPSWDSLSLPRIKGYAVREKLGSGGMGVVYEAVQCKNGRAVALKVMKEPNPAALERFRHEFRIVQGLCHRNLVTLYELVADDAGQCFFTMELLEGVNFLTHVRGKPGAALAPSTRLESSGGPAGGPGQAPLIDPVKMSRPSSPLGGSSKGPGPAQEKLPPVACDIERLRDALRQLAEGLAALHGAGVLHRDVKPGNVLVTPSGRVVLLDFGVAAELGPGGQDGSGGSGGTPAYMAPEQGARRPAAASADWYAVGVMLYEALTGRLPFDDLSLAVLVRKQREDPPHPAALVAEVPADLAELCVGLLRRHPEARPAGEEVLRRLSATRPPPARQEVTLVGRAPLLRDLDSAFEATRRGRTVVVALSGRSGVGKSALLRHFLDGLSRRGEAVVLTGRCYEQESVPYKALDGLVVGLARYLKGLPTPDAVAALMPRDVLAVALARVFPVLGRVAVGPGRGGDVSDRQELRRRAVAGLRELLTRLGDRCQKDRRPLVLAVDDLQWGDADSAFVLADLLRPPDPPALLLVGSFRSEDVKGSPCLPAFLGLVRQGAGLEGRELAVEPLALPEAGELARALLPEGDPAAEEHAEQVARQSGGYPYLVHVFVQLLRASRPLADLSLDAALWDRVCGLPEEARVMLEVVAVVGRPLDLELACRAAEVRGEPRQALAPLRADRLLRSGSGEHPAVEAYHDRVRETVVAHLEPDVLRWHHRHVAEVLEEGGDCDPEELADHYDGAGDPARAGRYYARAAGQAAEGLAFDRAAKLYRAALRLREASGEEERPLRVRLGDALAAGGRGAESAREYLTAAAGAARPEALELQRKAALQLLRSGHVDEGLATLRTVLAAVGLRMPGPWRAALSWTWLQLRLRLRLRGLGFRRRAAEEVPRAELLALDVCQTAAIGLSLVDLVPGACFQTRSLLSGLRAGEPARLALALALEGAHKSIAGSRGRGLSGALLDEAERLAGEVGDPYLAAMAVLARCLAAAFEGDWPKARELGDKAEAALRGASTGTGVRWELGTAHRFTLWPLLFMGELAEIRRRLPGLIKEAGDRDDLYGETSLGLVVGTFVHLADDDPARAREELGRLMRRWAHEGFYVQHMNRLYDEAQIDLYEGKGLAAWNRLAEKWSLVEQSHLLRVQQVRIFLGHLRARSALVAAAQAAAAQVADPGPFLRAAERYARALLRERADWAEALARLVCAGLAAARGDGAGAAELLRDAAARCDATAMRLYAECARRRLGELRGGDEGARLMAEADSWMAGQGVVSPERMAALLVPGFGGAADPAP